MIASMTAFARQTVSANWGSANWEIRSVNQRYLEPNFRLPENFRSLEFALREKLRKRLARGKVDVSLRFEYAPSEDQQVTINRPLAASLLSAHQELQDMANCQQAPQLTGLLRHPGLIETPEMDTEVMAEQMLQGFDEALSALISMRQREGQSMADLVLQRIDSMSEQVAYVRQEMPTIAQWQRERLQNRLAEAKVELDEERIEQELVMVAQKIDVEEELDRLDTHLSEVTRLVKKGGTVGRRLDFLMQELNREANTLGSKSISTKTTTASVEMKVLIEQMREQIQNIE